MKFIVAEISKNWSMEEEDDKPLLATQFESVINFNLQRNYYLRDWKLSRIVDQDNNINETIIAIFESQET